MTEKNANAPRPMPQHGVGMETAGLVATGTLASRFAHDLNNFLTTILGKAELALLSREPDRMIGALEAGAEAARRARELVGQMQCFVALQRGDEVGSCDPVETVRPPLTLLSRYLEKSGISVDRRFGQCRPVVCDLGAVTLGVYHLLRNAQEALASTGGWIQVAVEQKGPEVEIRVSDDGPGLPAEVLERLSSPDFPSADPTRGGLAVTAQVARAHGGRLVAGTRSAGGATVSLCLPLQPDGN
jgi:signal transduction histidine kinase